MKEAMIFLIAWFSMIIILTTYGIYKAQRPGNFDVFIAYILSPIVIAIAYALLMEAG